MSEKSVRLNEKVTKDPCKKLVDAETARCLLAARYEQKVSLLKLPLLNNTITERTLIEMHLAGVSTRRAEDIIEALWDSKVSPSAISVLNKKAYVQLRIGGSVLCKVGGIRVSTWMAIARFLVLLKV